MRRGLTVFGVLICVVAICGVILLSGYASGWLGISRSAIAVSLLLSLGTATALTGIYAKNSAFPTCANGCCGPKQYRWISVRDATVECGCGIRYIFRPGGKLARIDDQGNPQRFRRRVFLGRWIDDSSD